MRRQRTGFQMKGEEKAYVTSEKEINKLEISNLPDKVFKVMIIKMSMTSGEEWINTGKSLTKK